MIKVTIDTRRFEEQLKKLGGSVDKAAKKVMQTSAREVVRLTKAETPIETRLLQKSIGQLTKYYPKKHLIVTRIGARTSMARYMTVKKVKIQRMHAKNFNYEKKQLESSYKKAKEAGFSNAREMRSRIRAEMRTPKMQRLAARAGMQWRNPAHYFHLQELGTIKGVRPKWMLTNAVAAVRSKYYNRMDSVIEDAAKEVTGQ